MKELTDDHSGDDNPTLKISRQFLVGGIYKSNTPDHTA